MLAIQQMNGISLQITEPQRLTSVSQLFENLFAESHNTRLIGGADEPIYLPARGEQQYHRLVYKYDYLSSALHEIAHWCIAGADRVLKQDFGYWYQPDGRSAMEQMRFQQVEVKPQALEWMFATACGHSFSISLDNLSGEEIQDPQAEQLFERAVANQCKDWCHTRDLPPKAKQFINQLALWFNTGDPYNPQHYRPSGGKIETSS